MAGTGKIISWIGAIVAAVGAFWGADFYLALIGAVIVAIGLLMK